MSSTARLLAPTPAAIRDGLRLLMAPPDWLGAIGDTSRVRAALERHDPEMAAGALEVRRLEVKRLRLKKGEEGWIGQYELAVTGPTETARTIMLSARMVPPGFAEPPYAPPSANIGEPDWRVYLPELRLELRTQPEDPALPALALLTDPEQARVLLQDGIRAGAPSYADLRIARCDIRALRYKPGSRATAVYRLAYAPEDAGRGWPEVVVAKTYSGSKGQNAYDGMRALWASPLARGDVVTIAEPLAYLPELKVLVQGPIAEERTLEDLIRSALRSGAPEELAALEDAMRKAGAGLAALHTSGIMYGELIRWEDELAEVREVIGRLAVPLPHLAEAAEPLLRRVEALAAETPPDPAMPAHRAFRPAQVLLASGRVGFIDFDGFGRAEPALDLSRFLRKARALAYDALKGRGLSDDEALARAAAISGAFLTEYERRVPVSRQRIALWETLDLLTLVLYCWTKVEPQRLPDTMLLLERHLEGMGVL
ncbi:MAG TPA: phosphotransferase [Roseiflexaceae bacterium]|nr:phosphotransferase [Roseiflexaceae bacterium]